MTTLVAITPEHHKHLAIDKTRAEAHGAELNLIPVITAEFTNLAVQYPIVLTKNGDTGEFVCAAMLGFQAKENLFWQDNQWQGIYLPLQIQRQPFFIGDANPSNTNDYVVCLDSSSPAIINTNDISDPTQQCKLFTENNQETDYFQQTKTMLAQLLQGEQLNKAFIQTLTELALIQPLSLEVSFANQSSTRLNGLYTIDQQKLAALSAEQIAQLHKDNWLPAIYAMTTSLGQIYALIERKNERLANHN